MKFTEEKLEKSVIMVNETAEMSSIPLNKLDNLKI
jgi:hypothetical protein